jgi:TIR domain
MSKDRSMNVFISYARRDQPTAKKIADGLKRAGLNVWYDADILPGGLWVDQISKALRDADAMVVLVTPETAHSKEVRREIDYALSKTEFRNRLIPVVMGSPEKINKKDLPWILWEMRSINLPEHGNQQPVIREIAEELLKAA